MNLLFVAIKQFGGKDRLFAANRQNKWCKKLERRFSGTFSRVIPILFPKNKGWLLASHPDFEFNHGILMVIFALSSTCAHNIYRSRP